jgi:hypothetical protein
LGAGLTTLLCTRIIVAKSEEVKTGCKLAEYSKEGCCSKGAVFPGMLMDKMNLVYLNQKNKQVRKRMHSIKTVTS